MNKKRVLAMLMVLVLASLACQAFSGVGSRPESNDVNAPSSSDEGYIDKNDQSNENETAAESDFPMTIDAYHVLDVGDGSILYYTKLSQDDVMKFYRDEYASRAYTENELLTVVSDGVFSMVFEGDPSGKSVVIQSVDLGDGSRTVAIRLEEL
jgi:hypothetical protein